MIALFSRATFQVAIEKTIAATQSLPLELASEGRMTLSKREVSKYIGELYIQVRKRKKMNRVKKRAATLGIVSFIHCSSSHFFPCGFRLQKSSVK